MDSIIEVVFLAVLTVTLAVVLGVGAFEVVMLAALFSGSKCGAPGVSEEPFAGAGLLAT